MAHPVRLHTSMSLANCISACLWSRWKFPGFILTFSTTSADAMATSEEKCTSATSGVSMPSALSLDLISRRSSTSFIPGTVSLMSCAPALYSLRHCSTLAWISDVCVLHIVWTTIGQSAPIRTFPACAVIVSISCILLTVCYSAMDSVCRLTLNPISCLAFCLSWCFVMPTLLVSWKCSPTEKMIFDGYAYL